MITQRFNLGWNIEQPNSHWFGLVDLIKIIVDYKSKDSWPPPKMKMLEIGSYMGESTSMFATSNVFNEIHCIEPFSGYEKFNDDNDYDWDFVYNEFKSNTRFFNNIILHKDFSYNIIDKFEDSYFDFIYIDGNHTYESVKKDIEFYLPKLKNGGIIGGHDYNKGEWVEVVKAVDDVIGNPDKVFWDTSWIKYEI